MVQLKVAAQFLEFLVAAVHMNLVDMYREGGMEVDDQDIVAPDDDVDNSLRCSPRLGLWHDEIVSSWSVRECSMILFRVEDDILMKIRIQMCRGKCWV